MDKIDFKNSLRTVESYLINSAVDISYINFLYAIIISAVLAYLVKLTFLRVSRTLNDREYFSDIFVPLAVITTLVITVIKFSLALSLGLVGALSIVRFRAAIKEPEELVYLFFIVAIGLANGANQYLVSIITTFFIIIILFLKRFLQDRYSDKFLTANSNVNVLQIQISNSEHTIDTIINKLSKYSKYLKLKSYKIDNELTQYIFWFDLETKNYIEFINYTQKIVKENPKITIDVYSRSGIYE